MKNRTKHTLLNDLPYLSWCFLLLLLALTPQFAQEHRGENYLAGMELIRHREFRKAELLFREMLSDDPASAQAAFALGKLYYQQCQNDSAIHWWKAAVRQKPQNSDYQLWLSRAYAKKGIGSGFFKKVILGRRAKKHLDAAIRCDSTNVIARHDLIRYFLAVPATFGGGRQKALEQAEWLQEFNPWEGYKARAAIYHNDGNLPLEEETYRQALADYPGDRQFVDKLSDLLEQQKRFAEIDSVLETLPPESRNTTRYWRARLALAEADTVASIELLDQLCSDSPQNLRAAMAFGELISEQSADAVQAKARIHLKMALSSHHFSDCNPQVMAARRLLKKISSW